MGTKAADLEECRTGALEAPSADAVRAALGRILASSDFIASDRARRFLSYIVDETLAGRSDGIKGLSVAIAVFDRDASFDAQNDPTVRVIAGRLRRSLEHYYLLTGQGDPVVIELPKGGYVPTFRAAAPAPAPPTAAPTAAPAVAAAAVGGARAPRRLIIFSVVVAAIIGALAWEAIGRFWVTEEQTSLRPTSPNVLVLPFADLGGAPTTTIFSTALTDEIVTALAGFKEITVFGVQTSRSVGADIDMRRLHEDLKASYVLEGSVRSDAEEILVSARLMNAANGSVLWSRQFDNPLTAPGLYAVPVDIAEDVAAAIAQPYGIVVQAESIRAASFPPDDLQAYLCTLQYYVYRPSPSSEGHAAVRGCLEEAVARYPSYATAWALLGLLYLDEARHALNQRGDQAEALERALAASREAVRLDPENARALQSLATTLFYTNRIDEAFTVGQRAIARTPKDAELLGQLGQLFGLAGRLEEGRALLEQAISQNPARAAFFHGTLALVAYMQRDYDTALTEIVKSDVTGLPIYHGIAAIIYAQKGLDAKARAAAAEFQRLQPAFVPNLWAELDIRNIPFPIQLHIAEGLEKAGLAVPEAPAERAP